MKKTLTLLLLLATFQLSAVSLTTEFENGYISVNESSTEDISPDLAEITIGVETFDKNIKKAVEDNKVIASKVFSSLKPLLSAKDYLKTGEYSARPQYSYTSDNKKVFDKYIVVNTVVVRTKNIQSVSKLIDTSISNGATRIERLQFQATDYSNECNETLSNLSKKAFNKANAVASAVNHKIVGVKSINATCTAQNFQQPFYGDMIMKNAVSSAESSTPIEGGKIKLYSNIDASFYVK